MEEKPLCQFNQYSAAMVKGHFYTGLGVQLVWLDGVKVAARLVTERSLVQILPGALPGNDCGQVVHTHMCLCSPSSIIWYQSRSGDALWLRR